MLDPPKIQALLKAPPVLGSLLGCKPEALSTAVSLANMDLSACPGGKRAPSQRLATLHPTHPRVAYLVEQQQSSPRKLIVVQDLNTRTIRYSMLLADLAVILYGEQDIKKIPAAIQTMGQIQSFTFFDATTLTSSHMVFHGDENPGENLIVQTSQKIIALNLATQANTALVPHQKSQLPYRISWHMHEANLGAVPSSNVLPITPTWFLVGCSDGSLKCWDSQTQTTTKSIRGLGKGDWIVAIQSANPHFRNNSTRRILTLTKRGIAYLIEVRIDDSQDKLEILPPLARFVGSGKEDDGEEDVPGSTLSYDAHRDWICWMVPAARKEPARFRVWSLDSLQNDFIQQSDKTLFEPQPHISVLLPDTEHSMTAVSLTHAGWEQDTLIIALVTIIGDVHIMGASGDFKSPIQVKATPLLAVSLSELLQQDAGLDFVAPVRGLNVKSHDMLPKFVVTTDLGILVLDLPSPLMSGSRHLHFGAGLGSLGKSILSIQHSQVSYGSLDLLQGSPVGFQPIKNSKIVYECTPPLHLPPQVQKRSFRTPPLFLQSPSGNFIALVWPQEFCYEILHTAALLQAVGNRGGTATRSPVVDKGNGISSLAWVGDDDSYAVLHTPDSVNRALALVPPLVDAAQSETTLDQLQQVANITNLKDIRSYSKNVVKLGGGLAKGAVSATMTVTNTATGALTTTAKAGMNTLSAAKAATDKSLNVATGSAKKIAKAGNKGLKKATFGLFGKKKKQAPGEGGLGMAADDEEIVSEAPTAITMEMQEQMLAETNEALKAVHEESSSGKRYVEMKALVSVLASAAEIGTSVAAATSSSLGEIQLRGGNRSPPNVVFGGPVLCVASRKEGENDGFAHFYAKKDDSDDRASGYLTTGPTLPFPDHCVWDDDGSLCAFVVKSQVSVFMLDPPSFSLLGSVQIGDTLEFDGGVKSVKFIHGVLYCCTWNKIYAVFLGDTKKDVCLLDTFLLASNDAPREQDDSSPPALTISLLQPTILGYQSGSLIVSSARGIAAVPLSNPLIRIGCLLPTGQIERAIEWFDAIPDKDHEILANFLERRGFAELAVDLPGISLETAVDLSMKYGFPDRLEELVENYGVRGLRAIDSGRGVSHGILGPVSDNGSVLVCVGAYLLAHGSVELVRRMATECLRLGDDGKKDALTLASILSVVDEDDASRLVLRAVEHATSDWAIGTFARNYVVADRT